MRIKCGNTFQIKGDEIMNKLELIQWLADNLDNWPSAVNRGPLVKGWTWHKDHLVKELKLWKDVKFERPESVSEAEWDAAIQGPAHNQKVELPVVEAMIDIETFDVTHDAVVFQAAVIFFDKNHSITYRELWNLNFDEQYAAGRDVSASTMIFHLGIPANAKAALQDKNKVTMTEFADHLLALFKDLKPKNTWAKGSFDFNILENMFKSIDRQVPWKFYQLRELRTLMSECGVKKGDVSHNALEDCVAQVAQLAECRGVIQAGKVEKISDAVNQKIIGDLRTGPAQPDNDAHMAPCLYSVDQGVTDSLPDNRVAYRADCGYQHMIIEGNRFFPKGTCTKCKRDITLEHDVKDLLEEPANQELTEAFDNAEKVVDSAEASVAAPGKPADEI